MNPQDYYSKITISEKINNNDIEVRYKIGYGLVLQYVSSCRLGQVYKPNFRSRATQVLFQRLQITTQII
jgi:hypothetical protein